MILPNKAQDVHAALAAAFNSGDLNQVLSIYDTSGIIVPAPNMPVSGKDQFIEAVKSIMAIKGKMEIKTVYCLQTENLAVGRSEWSITDGDEVKVSAKGIELLRQGPDGSWKVLIDHAFGALETIA